jgi:hypothetical protein
MVLAKTDMGLIATEGREIVVRAAVRRAVTKAREAMMMIIVIIKLVRKKKSKKIEVKKTNLYLEHSPSISQSVAQDKKSF